MSFIITVYTHEGLVMAADSRTTLTTAKGTYEFTNSAPKLFVTASGVGIATCGEAGVVGKPIAGFINDFALKYPEVGPSDLANQLIEYLNTYDPVPDSHFHVCGYDKSGKQRVFVTHIKEKRVVDRNTSNGQGAFWNGENDIMTRLVQNVATLKPDGTVDTVQPQFGIPFQYFSLQDAVDFAKFAMQATIGAIRFQDRHKTVGGPIDLLVIKPDGFTWIQRKELHA